MCCGRPRTSLRIKDDGYRSDRFVVTAEAVAEPPVSNLDNEIGASFFPDLTALHLRALQNRHRRQDRNDNAENDKDPHKDQNCKHNESIIMEPQQGVLWKRRDVFKNRWRPRWFVLQPSQGVLTYYLLTTPAHDTVATPSPVVNNIGNALGNSMGVNALGNAVGNAVVTIAAPLEDLATGGGGDGALRNRATSVDSNVSNNPIDYDVVPRGTIYLLGCTVAVNNKYTRPEENLYTFTIRPPNPTELEIHLAARTAQSRAVWVEKIARVCGVSTVAEAVPASATSATTTAIANGAAAAAQPSPNDGTAVRDEDELRPTTAPGGDGDPVISSSDRQQPATSAEGPGTAALDPATATAHPSRDTWKVLCPAAAADAANSTSSSAVYANVPAPLAAQIQHNMQTHLALCDDFDGVPAGQGWKTLFRDRAGHSAFLRVGDVLQAVQAAAVGPARSSNHQGQSMLQCRSVLRHPAKQVFNLLLDVRRRREFEGNVRHAERLQTINPHNFLEYQSYNAVWPTAAREFCFVTHWQVVGRSNVGNNGSGSANAKAICILSFSCRQAEELRSAVIRGHVRGNLLVSMWLLEEAAGDENRCRLTRLVSFDPAGGLTRHFINAILSQMAAVPAAIDDLLHRTEPAPDPGLKGPLTNESLVKDVVDRLVLADTRSRRGLQTSESGGNSLVVPNEPPSFTMREGCAEGGKQPPPPDILTQAWMLLAPVAIHRIACNLGLPRPMLWFCVCAFLAVRYVTLLHLEDFRPPGGGGARQQPGAVIGPVTCRFCVDLKGVLRFIANQREDREELGQGTAEVSVLHIVASAVARALKKEGRLHRRRVAVPWLFIDGTVDASREAVSVSLSENAGRVVTVTRADQRSVQEIADQLLLTETDSGGGDDSDVDSAFLPRPPFGPCLVLASPNYDETEMEVDAMPLHPDVAVVAVVGGVRLDRGSGGGRRPSAAAAGNGHVGTGRPSGCGGGPSLPPPRPVLSLSLTVAGPHGASDVAVCRGFAEEVQKLLQFPEMCDNP